MKYDTSLLHGNFKGDAGTGATLVPVYQSSAFGQETAEQIEKIFHNKAAGFAYTRISNPTTASFENRITYLEAGIASVAVSSGMAAISATFLNILSSGDEIISKNSIFGGTLDLFKDFENLGVKIHLIDEITEGEMKKYVNENTKAIFAETIGNPKLDVTDVKNASEIVHSFGLPFILDNTTATTYLVKGIDLGADIIINSASKYINGNSNSISGVITDSGNFKWTVEKYPIMKDYVKFGKFAFSASLRMERHCSNALALAESLEGLDGVREVVYPMLKSSPYYDIANSQFNGKGGGILTLRLFTKERAFAFINQLKYAINITNIGDTKTLVIHPSSTIYAHSNEEEQAKAGVYDDLIRVSVGIEDIEDLKQDFKDALDYVNKNYNY